LLSDVIMNGTDFGKIRKIARNYATILINYGYSDSYIYEKTLNYFYHDEGRISSNSNIIEFISLFPSESHEFSIIYKASNLFEKLKDACTNFQIKISRNFPIEDGPFSDNNTKNILSRHDGIYLMLDDIKARDAYSAKVYSDNLLNIFGTLFSIFHHKEVLSFKDECIIINKNKNELKKRGKTINTMHKCVDMKTQKSARILNEFISKFSLEKDSFEKFTNAAQLHSLALNSGSEQNQLINLWIALESIIPTNGSVSNIENVVSSTIPFLNMIYYKRLINKLIADIFYWCRKEGSVALNNINGNSLHIKFIKLLSLEENREALNRLKENTRDFHLLKDRIIFFENLFKSPKNIISGLNTHTDRLAQQIRRIYRARNLIVHTGNLPSYTSTLIENLHDYLDVIIGTLIELNISDKKIISISQGFKVMELKYGSFLRKIEDKNLIFNNNNIDLIFS